MHIVDKANNVSESDCCWPGCDSRRGGQRKAEEYIEMWRPSIRKLRWTVIAMEECPAALPTIFRAETPLLNQIRNHKALERC